MVEVQEAHSPKIGLLTKQDILQMIPQYHIRSIFIRQHLDREIVIGTIGDRGGGKSGSDAWNKVGLRAKIFRCAGNANTLSANTPGS